MAFLLIKFVFIGLYTNIDKMFHKGKLLFVIHIKPKIRKSFYKQLNINV
jgi:hypothetical protein